MKLSELKALAEKAMDINDLKSCQYVDAVADGSVVIKLLTALEDAKDYIVDWDELRGYREEASKEWLEKYAELFE